MANSYNKFCNDLVYLLKLLIYFDTYQIQLEVLALLLLLQKQQHLALLLLLLVPLPLVPLHWRCTII